VWPKFGILLAAAFAITLTLYEFGVRRWGPMRTLFGLKALPARTPAVLPSFRSAAGPALTGISVDASARPPTYQGSSAGSLLGQGSRASRSRAERKPIS
jgi:hypothetical protein